ncbi:MAG: PAS domain S-box protein [Proteobacteria bacterium]|nr:PAS domain S-box protein [Pseudomonadota bacterium]
MSIPNDTIARLMHENERLRSELAALKQSPLSHRNNQNESGNGLDKDKLRAILEAIPIAVAWADIDGIVEFTNRKFVELFGYTMNEVPTLQDWLRLAYPDPEYREFILLKWLAALEQAHRTGGEMGSDVADITCKDGSIRNVEIKATLISNCTLAIFDDLTESKQTQKALLESESRFKAIFNGARDGMLVADSRTQKFCLANESILDMLGYTENEILNMDVANIHPQGSLKEVNAYFDRQIRGEVYIAPSLPVKRKNGDIFYADISSGPLIIDGRKCQIGIFRDISERKKYEEAILQERDFSETALNSLPGIFYMFDQTGRFLRWNRNFETISGYSSEEMKQISPLDLFQGEDKTHIQERILLAFEKGSSDAEANLITKNGDKIPHYFTGLLSHIGGAPCLVGMGIDISRRKQAEKMQALGQLAGGIAHDFNNQLSAILGFAEMLVAAIDNEDLRYYAEMIARAATRSADLTRQLLAFAHKGKYQAEPVDIHIIIAEVVALLNRSIDKRITIKQIFSADPATTMGDPNQIQNAFLNLAINGRDAMPDGGELIFSTSDMFLDDAFCRNATFDIEPGHYLQIAVTDTGKGMEDEIQRHIYEPFFTTKEIGKGTGMGLAAVYGTIKNHKGAITVNSKPGQGSTFYVYLPIIEETAVLEKPAPRTSESNGNTALILVVDDEEMIRMLAGEILHALGYEVITCKDGNEAVATYQKDWERIHLVILDLVMPGISGAETFAALRRINPLSKVLLSSGYSIDGQAQSLLDGGALDFIQKPFTISQLTAKVAEALKQPVPERQTNNKSHHL